MRAVLHIECQVLIGYILTTIGFVCGLSASVVDFKEFDQTTNLNAK